MRFSHCGSQCWNARGPEKRHRKKRRSLCDKGPSTRLLTSLLSKADPSSRLMGAHCSALEARSYDSSLSHFAAQRRASSGHTE
jgi:hypothetical protein